MGFVRFVWAGMWRKKSRAFLTLLSLTCAFLLFGMLQALSVFASAGADSPYSDDARAGADLLLRSLAPTTRDAVVELRNRIRSPIGQATVSARIRRTTEEAVRRGRVLNISYLDADSTLTERSVEAIGFYRGNGWYLNAWCELRGAGRLFRLDRIKSARLTARLI